MNRLVIDQHYRVRHAESINDELILNLVRSLDGQTYPIELRRGEFEYFTVEPVRFAGKPYRVILVLCLTDDHLGVVNAFRVDEKEKDHGN